MLEEVDNLIDLFLIAKIQIGCFYKCQSWYPSHPRVREDEKIDECQLSRNSNACGVHHGG